jgi:hypothetical protein
VQVPRGEAPLRRRQPLAEGRVTPGEAQPDPWWTIESIVFDFDLRPVAVEFLRIRAPARSFSTMTRSPQTLTCSQSLAWRSMQRNAQYSPAISSAQYGSTSHAASPAIPSPRPSATKHSDANSE